MNSTSSADSSVFQPIEYDPLVSESGMAYSMIDVGSNSVWFVLSSEYTSKMFVSTSSFDQPCWA